jgi:nitrogenase molybdenum-iron protein alpha/beta subunit/MoaA/NifB/PqqE/SkfB family radical SAM enzyme
MKSFVNLNTNPCKMCMPMGSISAFFGVAKCMTILHGSQGCATYIRRHMATHYNEPIDIASSSLTEEGAVFGGEKNLVKGFDNLIRLYDPDVIGVATTCLAETIGEDTEGIVARYLEERPGLRAKIITVQSAGYAGTQFEGFFRTLRALVEQAGADTTKNGRVNIITNMISPADTRWLKSFVAGMGLDAIILPDISENLDGAHEDVYERLPSGGVTIGEIARMAGAQATIELTTFVDPSYSPGQYLYDTYGVPLYRLPLPVSLGDMDAFRMLLTEFGGREPADGRTDKERGRRLDAMVDSHKHNAQVRAAVYGEPDFVYAACRLLTENGAMPVVAVTGSVCPAFGERMAGVIAETEGYHLEETPYIKDDCDFARIEEAALAQRANVLVGSSDGRRICERTGLPLVRCAFPVHDHVGGQRIRTLGYEGALLFLDQITNAVIDGVESGFREKLKKKYFSPVPKVPVEPAKGHPCFCGCDGARAARIHLPVAPSCNIRCNYCVRRYDCANESRPGVTSGTLTPTGALERYLHARETIRDLNVVGIAGPGDSLADAEATLETLRLIREADSDVLFCISTNGLVLPEHIDELAALGLTHLTVTVNAVDPKIGARIYKHIDYRGQRHTGEVGASILLANQFSGLTRARALGMQVKVNTVLLPGINDAHIPEIMRTMSGFDCALANIMPHIPVKGSAFENLDAPDPDMVEALRESCEEAIPQMRHCAHCRADAAGPLGHDMPVWNETGAAREKKAS